MDKAVFLWARFMTIAFSAILRMKPRFSQTIPISAIASFQQTLPQGGDDIIMFWIRFRLNMKSKKVVCFGLLCLLSQGGCTSSDPEKQPPAFSNGGSFGTSVQSTEATGGQQVFDNAVAGRLDLDPVGENVAGTGGMIGSADSANKPDAGLLTDATPSGLSDAGSIPQDGSVSQDSSAPRTDAADEKPTTSVCSSDSSLTVGDNRATLQHDGRTREYVVYVPSSVDPGSPVPLVLDFHGNGSNSMQEESGSGWRQKADQEGFIVIYPDGVGNAWNVGNCCGQALSANVDDVGFARAMITATSEAACIDSKRVYATGISNGAGLAHRLACEAADVIAAIAATSADLVTDPCNPSRPISELSIRGLNDFLVAYEGGNTGSTGWYSPGAKGTLELWKGINQCTGSAATNHQYCETYSSCNANVEVTLCSLPNTGHILYNNTVGFRVPDVAWEMFKRQPMP